MADVAASEKVWDRAAVLELLDNSPKAVVEALKRLYARQTSDEQETGHTRERNGRGFNGKDAPLLTDIARKLPRYNDNLTPNQLRLVRGRIAKYWRQLLEEIEKRGKPVKYS